MTTTGGLSHTNCAGCGSPVPVEPYELQVSCRYCGSKFEVYELSTILKDGFDVLYLPDQLSEKELSKLKKKHGVPSDLDTQRSWMPYWHFVGEVEAFINGLQYNIGLSGDSVRRVTRRKTIKIDGRTLSATDYKDALKDKMWKRVKESDLKDEEPPAEEERLTVSVSQGETLDTLEEALKREFIGLREFRLQRVDRYQVTCLNFHQALLWVPFRIFRYSEYVHPGKRDVVASFNCFLKTGEVNALTEQWMRNVTSKGWDIDF